MSVDFDADAFAQRATGDVDDPVENHADAEGAAGATSDDVGKPQTWREMALATEPSPSLDEVDDPWNPEQGGTARIYRGFMKATAFDGMPAIGDIAIGAIEVAHSFREAVSADSVDESTDGGSSATADVDGVEVPLAEA